MGLNDFKDWLFDLINDAEDMDTAYLEADDRNNLLIVGMPSGNTFVIQCKKYESKD